MDTSRIALCYNLIQLILNMTSLLMIATAVVASSKYLEFEFLINLLVILCPILPDLLVDIGSLPLYCWYKTYLGYILSLADTFIYLLRRKFVDKTMV